MYQYSCGLCTKKSNAFVRIEGAVYVKVPFDNLAAFVGRTKFTLLAQLSEISISAYRPAGHADGAIVTFPVFAIRA
jgi:hypothetical protein